MDTVYTGAKGRKRTSRTQRSNLAFMNPKINGPYLQRVHAASSEAFTKKGHEFRPFYALYNQGACMNNITETIICRTIHASQMIILKRQNPSPQEHEGKDGTPGDIARIS